jgi:L-ascorbate metabolism protein UlaG (beta-lactamase superfamily)
MDLLTAPDSRRAAYRYMDPRHGTITFIGTATTLIQYADFTILTDPNFLHHGDEFGLGFGLTATRQTDPAMELEDLPPVDLVVLSHLHPDHFDRIVEQRLDRRTPIFAPPAAARALRRKGFKAAVGLPTWRSQAFASGDVTLRLTALPGRHAPSLANALMPPVMGSLIEFERGEGERLIRIYVSGDTLLFDQIEQIPRRYSEIDLALLHLGGARVLGLEVTMDAAQGVNMLNIMAPHEAIPIHYDDYTIFKSPLSDFKQAVREAHWEDRVRYLDRGDIYTFTVRTGRPQTSRW